MKGVSSAPGDYIYFKSQVPLHKIPIGARQWRYYDSGPKAVPPLICLPGLAGTADVFYKQVMTLSMKGYRVISVDIPRVWNHHEWVTAFEKFLDAIDVHYIHIYGTSLGGFLAQLFAQHRPRRVRSLILSNTFLETRSFSTAMPWAPVVGWAPSFLLKRYVLTGIPKGPHEPFIADSVDFVVSQVETLSRDDLASRLTLTVDSVTVGTLLLSDSFITLIDTNDYGTIPQQLKEEVSERYPGARRAYLKSGGDFPFLSRPDEVNLHLQLHLRRIGIEPWTELAHGAFKDSSSDSAGGSFYGQNSRSESDNNANGGGFSSYQNEQREIEKISESPLFESQLPLTIENINSNLSGDSNPLSESQPPLDLEITESNSENRRTISQPALAPEISESNFKSQPPLGPIISELKSSSPTA
jgi:maspardin